jgi:hypothetical protein
VIEQLEAGNGGHVAALEQPARLIADIRSSATELIGDQGRRLVIRSRPSLLADVVALWSNQWRH